jgi:beta-glucuronidase
VQVHLRRRVTSLDGLWDFCFVGDVDPDQVEVESLNFPTMMAVPGCWDATPDYAGRRGLAAYRRVTYVTDTTPHELVFESVQHWCRIFVDGQQLAEHAGGFTRFCVPLKVGPERPVTVVALVDNWDDAIRSPLHRDYYDWYQYGGIAGHVELHRLGEAWITDVRYETVDLVPEPVVQLVIGANVTGPRRERLSVLVGGQQVHDEVVELVARDTLVRRIALPGARAWSLEDPVLHLLQIGLGADDWRARIGLRTVAVKGRELTVNDRPVRLLGVNRHDSHPDHGFALPDDQRLADLQLISGLGANFVRGSHYPQDEGFLDLCDEQGIAVWCEATGWQPGQEQLADETWLAAAEHNIDEMVATAANHPSVLIWGCCNEGASKDPVCRPGFERLLRRLRVLDDSRPATYATMHPFQAPEVAADLADIVAVNTYPGWYWGRIEDIAGELDRIETAVSGAGLDDRPLIVAEIGAEAVPGWHDRAAARWSEEHQARLLDSVLSTVTNPGRAIAGVALWLFADFRVADRDPGIMRRPRAHNNKGIFDEYRRPKLSAEAVHRRLGGTPSGPSE